MKKRTAAFLILALCFAAVLCSGEALDVDLPEGSRLIGLLITTEDLSASAGEGGILEASCVRTAPDEEPVYVFGETGGLRLICFMRPGGSGEDGRIVYNVDDGFAAIDFNVDEASGTVSMDAVLRFVPGQAETRFFFNPVRLAPSGQVFAVPGDFMAVSAAMNPPGSSAGQTVREEWKHTEKGREITDATEITVRIDAVREPTEIWLLQFSRRHLLLKSEAFRPGTVPDLLEPLAEAEYLLLETVEKGLDGVLFTRREVFGRDTDHLNTLSCGEDGICLFHDHEVRWK